MDRLTTATLADNGGGGGNNGARGSKDEEMPLTTTTNATVHAMMENGANGRTIANERV